jgi:hypothetical protein
VTDFHKRARHPSPYQGDLFAGLSPIQTRVIAKRTDFDDLFEGFKRMRAISYVVSPDLLLEFFDERGYAEVEVVVGENLSDSYRKDLEQKGLDVTERLAGLIEKGALRVFVPTRTIHTKLYMLEKDDITGVIQTSANLTATAQEASKQINYAWYLDIPAGHPLLQQLRMDYEAHRHRCSPFMEDLSNLLKKSSATDRRVLIEAWLKGTAVSGDQSIEVKRLFHELSSSVAEASTSKEERVTVLQLPDSVRTRKQFERQLAPLEPVSAGQNQIRVRNSRFIRYVYEMHRVPLLILSQERRELLLGLDAPMASLTEAPSDTVLVGQSLELMEAYLQTVDSGDSADPLAAKRSMFEALLYVFFTPFAHEYMKSRRAKFGSIDARGPRFLYIYGPSQNGKSTFLRFSLRLLSGKRIEPLSRQDFTKTKIFNAALVGSSFPLVFDDQFVFPQLVITSNTPRLKEWAKSRVKRVDFDVHFSPTEDAKVKLARLFATDNPVFRWFSYLYLQKISAQEFASDDELRLARAVMKELYEYSKRPLPEFFPSGPVEDSYSPGRRDWRDLLFRLQKAKVIKQGDRKLVEFDDDWQHWEINDYQGHLPQTVKCLRKGHTIIIENPTEFDRWLGPPTGLISRMLGKGS